MKSRLIASTAIPLGLAGAMLCAPLAQAGEPEADTSLALAGSPGEDGGYIRTAQLEWLFGGERRQPVRERVRSRVSPESGADGEGQRYITIMRRDVFGNVTYQRVPAPEHKRAARFDSKNDRIRHAVAEKLRMAPPAPPTQGPLLITVSLAKQQLTLYDRGVAIAHSPVSSGTHSRPTPTGVFSILQKQYFHRSNMYSSAPMPYMQRITWAGVALHAGDLPGYAASHGCVRLPEDFAIRLWGTTQPGVRVIITQNEVKPTPISHPLLFTPKQPEAAPEIVPPPLPPAKEQTPLPPAAPESMPQASDAPVVNQAAAEKVAPEEKRAPEVVATTEAVAATQTVAATPVSLMEEIADTVPAVAEVTIVRGGPTGEPAAAIHAIDVIDNNVMEGERGVRAERITILRGGRPVEFQIVDMPPVSRDVVGTLPAAEPAAEKPAAEKPAAGAQVSSADDDGEDIAADFPRVALPDLGAMPPVLLAYAGSDFMQFARLQRRAGNEPQVPPAATLPATPFVSLLRPGPVSVYISRRTQRIYVRKGFEAVFDMPITVSQPHVAMGTYVFTANALTDDGKAFRWTVVSLDQSSGKRASADDGKAARAALDRIGLPEAAVSRISQIVDVGATVIVSDKGPGRAQSPDNDFSVVLR